MRTAEANRAEAKRQAQQEIEQFEQEFQGYLGSDGGKLQYVKENNLKPVRFTTKTIGGSTFSDGQEINDSEQVRVPVYQTPFGEVEDLTGYYERIEDFNRLNAINAGFSNTKELQKAIPLLRNLSTPSASINPRSQQVQFSTIEIKPEEQIAQGMSIAPERMKGQTKTFGVVSRADQPMGLLDRYRFNLNRFQDKITTKRLRGDKVTLSENILNPLSAAAESGINILQTSQGVGKFAISLGTKPARDISNFAQNPIQTGKSIFFKPVTLFQDLRTGTKNLPNTVRQTDQAVRQTGEQIGRDIRENPGAVTGRVVGELAIGAGLGKLAGTVAGQLVGRGGSTRIAIDPNLKVDNFIKGSQRENLLKAAQENPLIQKELSAALKNKDTSVLTYQLKNGEDTYQVLQISRGSSRSIKNPTVNVDVPRTGDSVFYAVKVGGNENLIGRSIEQQVGEAFRSKSQVIRLTPTNSKVMQAINRLTGRSDIKAEVTSVDEISTLKGFQREGKVSRFNVQTQTVINNIEKAQKDLLQKAIELQNKINKGQKVQPQEVRELIRIESKVKGLFTDKNFNNLAEKGKIITDTNIKTTLRNARLVRQRSGLSQTLLLSKDGIKAKQGASNIRGPGQKLESVDKRSGVVGLGFTKAEVPTPKVENMQVRKPFSNTKSKDVKLKASTQRDILIGVDKKEGVIGSKNVGLIKQDVATPQTDALLNKILESQNKPIIPKSGAITAALGKRVKASSRKFFLPNKKSQTSNLKSTELIQSNKDVRRNQDKSNFTNLSDTQTKTQTKTQTMKFKQLVKSSSINLQSNAPSFAQGSQAGLKTNQIPMSRFGQASKQKTLMRSSSVAKSTATRTTGLRVPPIIFKNTPKKTSLVKSKKSLARTPEKFDVFDIKGNRLNPIPFSKKSADGFGKLKTDKNIKASYMIKPTTRSGFRRSNVLERTSDRLGFKFQVSKRTPGLIVEKNRFRLEKGNTEVRQIQDARKSNLKFSKRIFGR